MWTVEDFVKELQDIQALAAVRQSPEMEKSLIQQLEKRMQHHTSWSPGNLCQIMKHVQESSLNEENRKSLLTLLDAKACGTVQDAANYKVTKVGHALVHIENYMSTKDWEVLSQGTQWEATLCMAKRLRALGMTALKEETKKVCTALLVYMGYQQTKVFPNYWAIYHLSQSLHDCFLQVPIGVAVAGVVSFPEDPRQLGDAYVQAAYKDDAPEARVCDGLASLVANHTPIRTTSHLLQQGKGGRSCSSRSNKQDVNEDRVETLLRLLEQKVGKGSLNDSCAQEALLPPDLAALKPPSLKQKLPIQAPEPAEGTPPAFGAFTAAPAASAKQESSPAAAQPPSQWVHSPRVEQTAAQALQDDAMQSCQDGKSLEDYEAEAMQALMDKTKSTTKQKPEGKKGKQHPNKAPAPGQGKKGKQMKRPAAATTKVAKVAKGSDEYRGVLGCPKCRGGGCSVCKRADFAGVRLPGKAAWEAWQKKKQLAKLKAK